MAQAIKRLSAGGSQYDLILDVSQKSQSVPNNNSVVSWRLWIRKNSGSGYSASDTKHWNVNIGGVTKSGTIAGYNFVGKSSIELGKGDVTIAHAADGTKSISFSGTFTDSGYTGIGSGTASSSMGLSTIPRASSFGTISGNTMGSGMTIAINRASGSFTHSMWYSFGSVSWATVGAGLTTSASFTPPISLASQVPNATSGTLTLILRTYNGSTQIGSDVTKTVTLYVPGHIVPTISSITTSEHTVSIGAYIQNRNGARVSINGAAGSYGSTIQSYSITGNNQTLAGQANNFSVFTVTGNVTFTGTVTDSRGRTASMSVTVNVLPNSKSVITTSITDKNFGDTFTINNSNPHSSYWYELSYQNPEGWTHWYSVQHQKTSWSVAIPAGEVGTVPNANSGTGRLVLHTYYKKADGSYYLIDSDVKTFTIHVPQSLQPTIGALTWTETVAEVANVVGAGYYVQGLSRPTLNLNPNGTSGSIGSTIRSITMTGSGLNGSGTALSHTFPSPIAFRDTQTYTVTVTDTRGRSVSKQISLTSIPYSKPAINLSEFNSVRTTSTGTPVWDGTTTKTSWNVSVSSIKPTTTELNKLKVSVHAMERGTTSYTHKYDTGSTLLSAINHSSSALTATYEKTKAYSIRLTVQDVFGQSSQAIILLPTAELTLDLGKNNMGVGKVWEKGTIDAIGQIYHNDGIEVPNGYVGVLPAGDVNTGAYWRGLQVGMYWKTDNPKQTNQFSDYAHVFVIANGNSQTSEKTIIWKAKADGSIWHSGTNGATAAMSWKRVLDSENHLLYTLAKDGTDYDRINGTTAWLRTPSAGLLPYSNGSSSLGTSSWRFSALYTNGINVNGDVTATRYKGTAPAGAWITGTQGFAMLINTTQQTAQSYHPLLQTRVSSGGYVNLGGIGSEFGIYGFKNGRTENGVDNHFLTVNPDTGQLRIQNQLLSDFIVEQGEKWQRWASGKMECWGNTSGTTDASGDFAVPFPAHFTGNIDVYITERWNSTPSWKGTPHSQSNTGFKVRCMLLSTGVAFGAGVSHTVWWHARGTWK